jgi:hypothetical protein
MNYPQLTLVTQLFKCFTNLLIHAGQFGIETSLFTDESELRNIYFLQIYH